MEQEIQIRNCIPIFRKCKTMFELFKNASHRVILIVSKLRQINALELKYKIGLSNSFCSKVICLIVQ